jgi:hypothetical protein
VFKRGESIVMEWDEDVALPLVGRTQRMPIILDKNQLINWSRIADKVLLLMQMYHDKCRLVDEMVQANHDLNVQLRLAQGQVEELTQKLKGAQAAARSKRES